MYVSPCSLVQDWVESDEGMRFCTSKSTETFSVSSVLSGISEITKSNRKHEVKTEEYWH